MDFKGEVVGFTGRRDGMTGAQKHTILELLALRMITSPGVVAILHGDAKGADAEFNELAKQFPVKRTCRPCTFEDQRAFTDAIPIAEPVNPMARNRAIVADADLLLAAPPTDFEVKRSGTWATIRYMRKTGKPCVVVWSDGSQTLFKDGKTHGR